MYTDKNYQTKKELKAAVASGKQVTVLQPGGMFSGKSDGRVSIEGPHGYHKWYASVEIANNVITKFIS